jgi:hypothetical protein
MGAPTDFWLADGDKRHLSTVTDAYYDSGEVSPYL